MDETRLDDVIARAQRHDPEAFDALIDAYSARLYGYFYRATGRRAEADDLLQELFVRLVGTIGRYRHDGRFEPWLFRIATNLLRDRIRRLQTSQKALEPHRDGKQDHLDVERAVDPRSAPPDVLQQREQVDRLQEAIARLPEPERAVILLRHFSQMSFRDIAELMETPLGTALARAHRGLTRLRELMGVEPAPEATAEGKSGS